MNDPDSLPSTIKSERLPRNVAVLGVISFDGDVIGHGVCAAYYPYSSCGGLGTTMTTLGFVEGLAPRADGGRAHYLRADK